MNIILDPRCIQNDPWRFEPLLSERARNSGTSSDYWPSKDEIYQEVRAEIEETWFARRALLIRRRWNYEGQQDGEYLLRPDLGISNDASQAVELVCVTFVALAVTTKD